MSSKSCSKCGEEKPLLDFARNKSKKDGYETFCKVCDRNRAMKYRKEVKKKAEEDPLQKLRDELKTLGIEISNMDLDDEVWRKKYDRVKEIRASLKNQPVDKFLMDPIEFGEKSSIADSIIASLLPLFISQKFYKIVSPTEFSCEFNDEKTEILVCLPKEIKFSRDQIVEFRQFVLK
jgi:uncharacterized Zn finger protein (UPF0148 family)